MALRKTVDFNGISVIDAHIRVTTLTINSEWDRMVFTVQVKVDSDSSPFDVFSESCPYSLEGGNPVRQAYDHLKNLEKFQGAEDI